MRVPFWLVGALLAAPAFAQMPGGPPPAVGVVSVEPASITETSEFVGRVQAIQRVALTARVTAFLEQRSFVEGAEVHAGDLLYTLERPPFEADVTNKEAAVADNSAKLLNANITLNRAQMLLKTPAGQQSTVDDAVAAQRSAAAQLAAAQAALRQSRINLDYTENPRPDRRADQPDRGHAGQPRLASPGPLAMIVSQDPMYSHLSGLGAAVVRFAHSLCRPRRAERGAGETETAGRLALRSDRQVDYVDPSVSTGTDTILLRAVIADPVVGTPDPGHRVERKLIDGAFVTVSVEGIEPVTALGIPRAAVMSDQSGNYVFVVGADHKVERRPIKLGQSTARLAVVADGLKQGETVILEGLQRARPGMAVNPAPVGPGPAGPAAPKKVTGG